MQAKVFVNDYILLFMVFVSVLLNVYLACLLRVLYCFPGWLGEAVVAGLQ